MNNKLKENDKQYPTISIIIPTFNRAEFIADTVLSFINQEYPKDKYEIIVIDNNSSDDTKTIIQTQFKNTEPKVKYLFEKRIGNHYARNSAAKTSQSEILYFADDDILADKLLLSEIIIPFIFDKNVATATGRILPKWSEEPPAWVKKYLHNKYLSILDPPESFFISRNINFLYSCHQAVRRDVFFTVGGFNPESFGTKYLGDGETGLNIKIKKLGYLFGYNGKSVSYHIMPKTRFTQKYLNRRLGNSGFSQAYTDFRKRNYAGTQIFLMIIKTTFIYLPFVYIVNIINLIKYRDINISRFFVAHGYYYKNNLKYCFWLLFDKTWRKYTLKSDWTKNENDFYDAINKRI
ncbi:MAG: glycosyltransferase [Candidatus Gracilibacteria bacterium]